MIKTKVFITAALICCLMAGFTVIADLSGKWTGTIKEVDGSDIVLNYVFKVDGDQLTGTLQEEGEAGAAQLDSGIVKGNNISFTVKTSNGVIIRHTGVFYGDSVSMNFDFGGAKFHTTLKRAVQ